MSMLGIASARWLRPAGETGLGIVLALVPLALWIAWSPVVLLAVLVTGGVCAALLIAISALQDDAQAAQLDAARVVVPETFVEEVHRLSPLVYHHGLRERRRFRRAMEKLRRLMR